MAGTIVAGTLSDGTYTTSMTNAVRGACRAWVKFNGTGTPSITGSYNVSSITDSGTGLWTVNFTTAMPDANYASLCTSGRGAWPATMSGNNQTTTSSGDIRVCDLSSNNQDIDNVHYAAFR